MVLGLDLASGVERMGHKRATKTRELVAALGDRAKDKRLVPVRQRPVPEHAILKVTWNGPRRSHFVVHWAGYIYDPEWPDKETKHIWDLWVECYGRVTSALEVAPRSACGIPEVCRPPG